MCAVRRNPLLHYLALGQFQGSYPILYLIFGTCKVMLTTLFSFLVLFQSSELSNNVFYNFIIALIHFTLEDKSILKFGSSNSEDLE